MKYFDRLLSAALLIYAAYLGWTRQFSEATFTLLMAIVISPKILRRDP